MDLKFTRERCKVFAFCVKNFTFYSVLNTLYQSLNKKIRRLDARSSFFMQEEFYFLKRFKHALPIIDYKFAWRCKVFAFYAYLNTLLWNLAFKKLCVFALRILLGDRGHQGTGYIEDCMCIKYG